MSTSNYSKTGGVVLLAHTQVSSGSIIVGSAVSVDALLAARIGISMGRTVATALTNELLFRLQGSLKDSGDDEWFSIFERTSLSGKTAASATTLNGSTSAGATTFVVTSATGLAKGDKLYLRETGTPGDSEWCEIKDISGTTVTPVDALTRAHTNGITITDLHERFSWTESLAAIRRVRLIVDGGSSTSGQTVDVLAWLMTLDSIQTV